MFIQRSNPFLKQTSKFNVHSTSKTFSKARNYRNSNVDIKPFNTKIQRYTKITANLKSKKFATHSYNEKNQNQSKVCL